MSVNQPKIEPDRLIESIVNAVLEQSAASPDLARAILLCSVPRWFDLEVVTDMRPAGDAPTLSPSEVFEKLQAVPFCEPHPTRPSTYIFGRDFRECLLQHKEIRHDRAKLHFCAAESFKRRSEAEALQGEQRFQNPDFMDFSVERVYHLQQFDVHNAVKVVHQICAETLAVWTSAGGMPEVSFCLEFLGSLEWPKAPEQLNRELTSLRAGINALLTNDDVKALKTLQELAKEPTLPPEQQAALNDWMGQIHLWDKERVAAALERFQIAERLTPNDAIVHAHLAQVYYSGGTTSGRFDLATLHARKALELAPGKAYGFLELGKLAGLQEDHSEAITWYEKAMAVDPGAYVGYLSQSESYSAGGAWSRALAMIDKAIEVSPDIKYYGLVRRGNVYRDARRYSEAFVEYAKAIEEAPDRIDAYGAAGSVYASLWQTAEAEERYRKAIELKPEVADGYVALARLFDQQGKGAPAIAACQEAQDKGIESKELYLVLLDIYHNQNRVKEFQRVQKQLVKFDPAEEYAAHCGLGDTWLAKAEPGLEPREKEQWLEKARREYKKALSIDANRGWAHISLAKLAIIRNEDNVVQLQRQLIIKRAPWAHYQMLVSLGRTYLDNFHYQEAETTLHSATELASNRTSAWRVLSEMYYLQGEPKGVERAWTKLVEINPTSAYDLHMNLGDTYQRIEEYTRARAEYTLARDLEPDRYDAYWELGNLDQAENKSLNAIEKFQLVENKAPGQAAVANQRIAAIYLNESMYAEAEKAARKAMLLNDQDTRGYIELARLGVAQRNKKLLEESRQRLASISTDKLYDLESAIGDEYRRTGDHKKAERAYRDCIKQNSEKAAAHVGLGRLRLTQERYKEAKASLTRALKIDSTHVTALSLLSQVYEVESDLQRFLETQRRIVEVSPAERFNTHLAIGTMYEKVSQFEEAEQEFRKAIEISPWRADAYAAFGSLLRKFHKPEQAREAYEEATAIAGISYQDLGSDYERQGKMDDAFEVYRLGLEHESAEGKSKLYIALASLHTYLKDLKPAEEEYRLAISLNPKMADGYVGLAQMLSDAGRPDQAIEVCRQMARQEELAYSAYVSIGNILAGQEKYEEAEQSYEQALSVNPKDADAYLQLSFLYQRQNRLDKVEQKLLEASEAAPDLPEPHRLLAELRERQERWDDAIKLYRRIVELQPTGVAASQAYLNIGTLLIREHRYQEAELELQQAVQSDPGNAGAYYALGLVYEQQEKIEQAIELYRRGLELQPSEGADAHLRIANLLVQQKRYDEAEPELQNAVQSDSANAEAYYNLGNVYEQQGKVKLAIRNYTKATEVDPYYKDAYLGLGRIYAQQEDTKGVARMARRILGLKLGPPEKYGAHLLIADVYGSAKDTKQAANSYRQAISLNPKIGEAYVLLAQMLADANQEEEALEVCRLMAAQEELACSAYVSIGNILVTTQKYEEAEQSYEQAIKLDPKRADAYLQLALLHYRQDKPDKVEQRLLQAAEAAPEMPEPHRLLAELREQQERWDEAIKLYRRVVELEPTGAQASQAYVHIGTLLASEHRYEEAEEELQKAVQSDPNNSEAYYNLGKAYERQDKMESAIENYTRATEIAPKFTDAYAALGLIFGKQGDTKSLAQLARHLLELALEPIERYKAYLLIAKAYQVGGLYEWAIANLEKALAIEPKGLEAYGYLGLIYETQRRWGRARDTYRKIGQLSPEWLPDVHLRLGHLFVAEGQTEEAEKEFRQIQATLPDNERFELVTGGYLIAAALYRKQGNLEGMRRLCTEVLSMVRSLRPVNHNAVRHQGVAALMLRDYAEAAKVLRQILKENPDDTRARLYLAVALLPLGDAGQAQAELMQAVAQAKTKDEFTHAIAEAEVLSTNEPELAGAKDLLQALRDASDESGNQISAQT